MRTAIVHDYLNQFGGAEQVVLSLHETFPEAPLFTSIFDEKRLPEVFRRMDIRTSFMQNLPQIFSLFKLYLFLYPLAFERLDLSGYDVVLSSSSAFAKGVNIKPEQLHICYCYTPMRFVWRYEDYMRKEAFPGWLKEFLPYFLEPLKKWDLETSRKVDHFVAISHTVAERIQKIYRRESAIINPPVECEFFVPSGIDRDYYLVVSRLNAYKRIDIVVEAFNELDLSLKIIGDGPERRRLQKKARGNVEFLGWRPGPEVARHMAECRALIFPGEEDFGIVPIEAMSAGRPVIAYRAGGAKETVIDGVTGLFFDVQSAAALVSAVKRFRFEIFNKGTLRQHALKYDKKVFQRKIRNFIIEKYEEKFHKIAQ
jgi:glycosyltransferase involved in cell wall biosynthesis